ncbi:MAG: anchored repeat ABC transporter, substrate-binding protein [Kocuria sp.]|nr:anchored repeat ABC transporter, substrate-binding protein [Kocuria sp.]
MKRRSALKAFGALGVLATTSCSGGARGSAVHERRSGPGRVNVVVTTPILADVARRVGSEHVSVTSLVPSGADPHSHEPSLRNIRDLAYADLAFTNGMLLEQQKLLRTVTANLPDGATGPIPVAENIEKYGGVLRPMTEDLSMDTVWLGMRVEGTVDDQDRPVTLETTAITGPGRAAAFVTETFGRVTGVADSATEGARRGGGTSGTRGSARVFAEGESTVGRLGAVELPQQAHTHLSWAFTEPGRYSMDLRAVFRGETIATGVIHFAVGIDAKQAALALGSDAQVLDAGHADITADVARRAIVLRADAENGPREYDPASTVVVPAKALQELPGGSQYRFLGRPGDQMYLLAQAVLGKHVHGDIDPHFWHAVPNVKAAAQVMRDHMAKVFSQYASAFQANAHAYLGFLDGLEQELREAYGSLPESRRALITAHDGYGYLAEHYGLKVEGFVAPVPGTEPGLQQRQRLARAIRDLHIPTVFVDKGATGRGNVLQQVADDAGVRVAQLYSDTLDADAPNYEDMMRHNARTITDHLRG